MSLLINELTKLKIVISYDHPDLLKFGLSGKIQLDEGDWRIIIQALDIAGYEIVQRADRNMKLSLSDNINLKDKGGS